MRVLLDECIPLQVVAELPRHNVRTIRGMRWRGKKNGELLQLASSKFDVFVTIDRGLAYQQRIAHLPLGVVTLIAPSNEIGSLRPLMPRLRHAVLKVKPGQTIRVEA
jgi:predicted nuclease of predicted toxin-antitoxin system